MCTFLKGDYERYKVKKEKQLADGGHMGRIIGIDLGTTNSAAAVWENTPAFITPPPCWRRWPRLCSLAF